MECGGGMWWGAILLDILSDCMERDCRDWRRSEKIIIVLHVVLRDVNCATVDKLLLWRKAKIDGDCAYMQLLMLFQLIVELVLP